MKSGFHSKIKGSVLILLGVAIIALSGVLFWSDFIKSDIAYLEIYLGDQKRVFEGEAAPNMTVLDALIASSVAGQITLRYKLDPLADETKIITLNGHDNLAPEQISLFVNSQAVAVNKIHLITIKPGDVMTVRLP